MVASMTHKLERHRCWWETGWRPMVTGIGAVLAAGAAITGAGPDWLFRVLAVLLCVEKIIEVWANRIGLVRRYQESQKPSARTCGRSS